MSASPGAETPAIIIERRLAFGYQLLCRAARIPHRFVLRRLGPSVECAACGRTALSVELATEFLGRRMAAAE